MMRSLLKSVVAHRWYVLMAILESDTWCCRMRERSPHGLPSFCRMVSLAPHTRWMIDRVRASELRRRREQRASAWARACHQGIKMLVADQKLFFLKNNSQNAYVTSVGAPSPFLSFKITHW
jgi:hypothetical protein